MRLVVLESASDEVEAIHRYIAEHNPLAAERIKDRIVVLSVVHGARRR